MNPKRFHGTRANHGITVAEVAIALAVFSLLAGALFAFSRSALRSMRATDDRTDAMQSAVTALELMRSDIKHLVYQTPRDLMTLDGGRGVSMLVPTRLGNNLWETSTTAVTYTLVPVAGSRARQLQRVCGTETRRIPGCLLKDLLVRYVPPGATAALQGYLEVTLIGMATGNSTVTYTSTALFPIDPLRPPAPYTIAKEEER